MRALPLFFSVVDAQAFSGLSELSILRLAYNALSALPDSFTVCGWLGLFYMSDPHIMCLARQPQLESTWQCVFPLNRTLPVASMHTYDYLVASKCVLRHARWSRSSSSLAHVGPIPLDTHVQLHWRNSALP